MNNAFINMHIAEQTAIQSELMLSQGPCSAWEPHGFNSFLGSQAWQSLTFYTCLVAELFGNEKSNGKQPKAWEGRVVVFENLDNSSLYLYFIHGTSSGMFSYILHSIAMHLSCRVRGISLVNAVIFSFFSPWACYIGYFIISDRYCASMLWVASCVVKRTALSQTECH